MDTIGGNNMKKYLKLLEYTLFFICLFNTKQVFGAGIYANGGGEKRVGDIISVNVNASGTTFDSFQGVISVSGPATITSFIPGSATWLPGKTPGNGVEFVGLTSATNSQSIASIKLKATQEGTVTIKVENAKLALAGSVVGSDTSSVTFNIAKAIIPAGAVKINSSSHPDQNASYEEKTIILNWEKSSGVSEFSYDFNQSPDTIPPPQSNTAETTLTKTVENVGTYYFHIRAKNADGWGGATHFKINIKEPDPKIDESLKKPLITAITKDDSFSTDINKGTVSGIKIIGTGEPGYKVLLTLSPSPGDLALSADIDKNGNWEIKINQLIESGYFQVFAQAQKEKTLTSKSELTMFETVLNNGGNVYILTKDDLLKQQNETTKKAYLISALVLILLIFISVIAIIYKKRKTAKVNTFAEQSQNNSNY